jgi:hypothetical protein
MAGRLFDLVPLAFMLKLPACVSGLVRTGGVIDAVDFVDGGAVVDKSDEVADGWLEEEEELEEAG